MPPQPRPSHGRRKSRSSQPVSPAPPRRSGPFRPAALRAYSLPRHQDFIAIFPARRSTGWVTARENDQVCDGKLELWRGEKRLSMRATGGPVPGESTISAREEFSMCSTARTHSTRARQSPCFRTPARLPEQPQSPQSLTEVPRSARTTPRRKRPEPGQCAEERPAPYGVLMAGWCCLPKFPMRSQ